MAVQVVQKGEKPLKASDGPRSSCTGTRQKSWYTPGTAGTG